MKVLFSQPATFQSSPVPLPRNYQEEHLDDIPAGVRNELAEEYARFVALASRLPGLRIV